MGLTTDPPNQETLGWGPGNCGLTRPGGHSDAADTETTAPEKPVLNCDN